MAIFEKITGPDGKLYDVEANSRAEAEQKVNDSANWTDASEQTSPQFPEGSTIIDIPETGGKIYQTPAGEAGYVDSNFSTTDPITLQRIQMGENPGDIFKEGTQESVVQKHPALARGVTYLAGLPFAGEYIDEMSSKTQDARLLRESMEATRPIESAAGQVAVGITSTAPLGTVAPALTRSKLGRAFERGVQGGLFGSGEGVVSGYGAGEDSDERFRIATERGLFGGIVGTPLGVGGGLLEGIVEKAKRINYSELAAELGVSDDAATVIGKMATEGASIDEIERRLMAMGSQARLANAGPAAKNLLDIAQAGGAVETVTTGVRQAGREIRQDYERELDSVLGQPAIGPKQIFRETSERTAPQRDRAYKDAYSVIIDYSSRKGKNLLEVIDTIPERYLSDALQKANELMQIDKLVVPQFKTIVSNGKTKIAQAPSIIQLDYLKRALGDMIEDNTDKLTGKLDSTGIQANKLYHRLKNTLDGISPKYKKAVEMGLNNVQEGNAIRYVENFNKTSFEDFRTLILRASGESRNMIKSSMKRMLRTRIDSLLGEARATISNPQSTEDSVNAAIKVFKDFTTGNSRKKLRLILNADEYKAFQTQMERVGEQLDLQAKTARGSATAFRTQGSEMVEEIASPGVIRSITEQGDLPQAGSKLLVSLMGPIANDNIKATNILNEVGAALLEKRGDAEAMRIVGIIKKIRDLEPITQQEAQMAGQMIQSYMRSAGYETAQQTTD